MANTSKTSIVKKSSVTKTQWLNNALKSIGVSQKNVFGQIAPNINDAISSAKSVAEKVSNNMKNSNTSTTNRILKSLENNNYVKAAKNVFKNGLRDLASGNFYSEDSVDNFFGDSEDETEFTFGDDGEELNINVNSNNDAGLASLSNQINRNTELQLKTSKASMDAYIAVSSANMMQIGKVGEEIVSHLSSINDNISALVQFNNENMNQFIESSKAFYEKMSPVSDSVNKAYSERTKLTDVISNRNGGISFSEYKKYITEQFKSSGVGGMASFITPDMINMIASNPIGMASESLIKLLTPKIIINTLGSVDKAFSTMLPNLLNKIADWQDNSGFGIKGMIKSNIGKIFGIRDSLNRNVNTSNIKIDSSPVPFDGITRHTINEVITKELREQTQYLKIIASHYDKQATGEAVGNSRVFDFNDKKWISQKDISKNIIDILTNSITSEFKDSSFGKAMNKGIKNNANLSDKQQESMLKALDQLYIKIANEDKYIDTKNIGKGSKMDSIINSLNIDNNIKKYFNELITIMNKENPFALNNINTVKLHAQGNYNKKISDIENNPNEYNFFSSGLDNASLIDIILKNQGLGYYETDKDGNYKLNKKGERIFNKNNNKKKIKLGFNSNFKKMKEGITGLESDNPMDSKIWNIINGIFDDTGYKDKVVEQMKDAAKGKTRRIFELAATDSKAAMNEMGSLVLDQISIVGGAIKEKILDPIKGSIFGEKTEHGREGGLLSPLYNSFSDVFGEIKNKITGKEYTKSDGTVIPATKDTVFANLASLGKTIKDGLKEKIFGSDEVVDEKGNVIKEKGKSIFSQIKESFKSGMDTWNEAIFGGTDENGQKIDQEKTKTNFFKKVKENMPAGLTGGVIGMIGSKLVGGSFLGSLVGGPLGGAIIGTALGYASKSEKFQTWLFGKEKDGERQGGFISKKVQDYFKENKNKLIGGAAFGLLTKGGFLGSMLPGMGFLSSLVGGPVAGAILGLGTTIAFNSKTFKDFLFGNEESGRLGLIKSISQTLSKRNKETQNELNKDGKFFGTALIGTGAGALAGGIVAKAGLLGAAVAPQIALVGGALGGLALSIKANAGKLKEFLFGKDITDEEGNKVHRDGIVGQLGTMMQVTVLNPLKREVKYYFKDAMNTFKNKILGPIELAAEPLTNFVMDIKDKVTEKMSKVLNSIGGVAKGFGSGILKVVKGVIKPFTFVLGKTTEIVYETSKAIITLPFKILDITTSVLRSKAVETFKLVKDKITTFFDDLKEKAKEKLIDPIAKFIKTKILKSLLSGITFIPRMIGGAAQYLGNKITKKQQEKYSDKNAPKETDFDMSDPKQARAFYNQDYKFNRGANKLERKITEAHDKNEAILGEAFGWQKEFTIDTEENRNRLKKYNKKLYNKLNLKVDAKEVEAPSAEQNAADILNKDAKDLTGEDANIKSNMETAEHTRDIRDLLDDLAAYITGRKKRGYEEKDKKSGKKTTSENVRKEAEKKKQEEIDEENEYNDYSSLFGKSSTEIAADIEAAGGLGKYIKNGFNKYLPKETRDKVWGNVRKNLKNPFLNNTFKPTGKGYATGTDNATPGMHYVGEKGPEVVSFTGGEKVTPFGKSVPVVITSFSDDAYKTMNPISKFFKNITGTFKNKATVDTSDILNMADDGLTNSEAAFLFNNSSNRTEEEQEEIEDTMARIVSDRQHKDELNKEIEKGVTKEEAEKQRKEERENKKVSLLGQMVTQVTNPDKKSLFGNMINSVGNIFSSIFDKKLLYIGGFLLLLNKFPWLMNIIESIGSGIVGGIQVILKSFSNFSNFLNPASETPEQTFSNLLKNGGLFDENGHLTSYASEIVHAETVTTKTAIDKINNNYNKIKNKSSNTKDTKTTNTKNTTNNNKTDVADNNTTINNEDFQTNSSNKTDTTNNTTINNEDFDNTGKVTTDVADNNTTINNEDFSNTFFDEKNNRTKLTGTEDVTYNPKTGSAEINPTAKVETIDDKLDDLIDDIYEDNINDLAKYADDAVTTEESTLKKFISKIKDAFNTFAEKIKEVLNKHKSTKGVVNKIIRSIKKMNENVFKKILNVKSAAMKVLNKFIDVFSGDLVGKSLSAIFELVVSAASKLGSIVVKGIRKCKDFFMAIFGTVEGYINTGTVAQLFHVDQNKVDDKMRVVSSIVGGLKNYDGPGKINMLVSIAIAMMSIIYACFGYDMFQHIATIIYGLITNDGEYDKLLENQESFKNQYNEYATAEIENYASKDYDENVKMGLVDSKKTSKENFVSNAKDTFYNNIFEDTPYPVESFQEYNERVNPSFESATVNTINNVNDKIFGTLNETYFVTDQDGQKYLYENNSKTGKTYTNFGVDSSNFGTAYASKNTLNDSVIIKQEGKLSDAELNGGEKSRENPEDQIMTLIDQFGPQGNKPTFYYDKDGNLVRMWVNEDGKLTEYKYGGLYFDIYSKLSLLNKTPYQNYLNDSYKDYNYNTEEINQIWSPGPPMKGTDAEYDVAKYLYDTYNVYGPENRSYPDIIKEFENKQKQKKENVNYMTNRWSYYSKYGAQKEIKENEEKQFQIQQQKYENMTKHYKKEKTRIDNLKFDILETANQYNKDDVDNLESGINKSNTISTKKEIIYVNKNNYNYYKKNEKDEYWSLYTQSNALLNDSITTEEVISMATNGLLYSKELSDSEKYRLNKGYKENNEKTVIGYKSSYSSGIRNNKVTTRTINGNTTVRVNEITNDNVRQYSRQGIRIAGAFGGGFGNNDKYNNFKYYSQNDPKWANLDYSASSKQKDGATIANAGCGPTAMSMIISQLGNKNVTPVDMANYSQLIGTRDNTGTNWDFIDNASQAFGINSNKNYNPSSSLIANQLDSGKPMILSGVSNDNSVFTNAGHYVVAVGRDANGKVIVNDPRGKNYSKHYNIDEIAKHTNVAWSFGNKNNGFGIFTKKNKNIQGGRGSIGDQYRSLLISIALSQVGYVGGRRYLEGIGYNTQADWCAAFVGWCLGKLGIADGNIVPSYSSSMADVGYFRNFYKRKNRFYKANSGYIPKAGDLILYFPRNSSGNYDYNNYNISSHIGIVESCDGQTVTSVEGNTGWGTDGIDSNTKSKVYRIQNYISKPEIQAYCSPDYDALTKEPGNIDINKLEMMTDTFPSVSIDSSSSDSSSDDSSNSVFSNLYSNISSIMSELTNRTISGMLTGNWDTNWDSFFSNNKTTTNTSFSNTSINTANVTGNNNAEKIWNGLRSLGYSKATTAGIMGNMQIESGLDPTILEYGMEGKDNRGAGLCQWIDYTNKNGRWKQLSDYADSKNKNWTDLQSQLEFLDMEIQGINGTDPTTAYIIKNKTGSASNEAGYRYFKNMTNPENAATLFQESFERAQDAYPTERRENARTFYNTYEGTTGGFGTGLYNKKYKKNNKIKIKNGYGVDVLYNNNFDNNKISPSEIYESYKYSNSYSQKSDKYLEIVIKLLSSIADNTLSANDKLKLLENLQSYGVNNNTTNMIIPNNSSQSQPIVVSKNNNEKNNSISRNAELASIIAKGI